MPPIYMKFSLGLCHGRRNFHTETDNWETPRGTEAHYSNIYRHRKHTTAYPERRYGDAQDNEMCRKSTLG